FIQFRFIIFLLVVFANVVSTFFECGLHECPDDQTRYLF
ncbi:disulfide bond formation protein B, partial [Francisella tularensis subsp. holarctica]|nr:disulfide bond formation protein B [Francisella tularensis subsp. holarctica]